MTDTVRAETRKCTDCGLCLASCPTFTPERAEGDSPRGRVHLLRSALDGPVGTIAAAHLAGCLECGACHDPCPTGVRVADAVLAYRATAETAPLAERAAAVADAVDRDPGVRLTLTAVHDLLAATPGNARADRDDGVLPVFGPLLRRVAPEAVARVANLHPRTVVDEELVHAVESASGLLRDVGLHAEHDTAAARLAALARSRPPLSVVVFDPLLRPDPALLPEGWRLAEPHDVYPLRPSPVDWVRDDSPDVPVTLARPVLDTVYGLVEAKRRALGDRTLLTADARALVRYPRAVHIATLLDATEGTE
ncbi:4Fe-4S dicluster domain-containing protein [Lentzea sp. JNUCC 0626]|uniref:4Fe-4S dicluster domain-containing protein n=1 Tax=Lentzea sp. JNUCC 0626 TaxID=3367513 RepID=UPI0037486B62